MKLGLALATVMALGRVGCAQAASSFIAPAPPKPKIVRLLGLARTFDMRTLQAFERASGFQIAYDAYSGAADFAVKRREGPYDLVVVSGPALAREIALGALARLNKARLPNARAIQPPVAAKLAAYDPSGAYAVPFGWFATGLIYDEAKVMTRLGAPPTAWADVFSPTQTRRLDDCGIALPDARDALFIAAWRMLRIDPDRASTLDVERAGALLERARHAVRAFATPDVAGALASGAACLAVGDAGEAAAASARSREGGARATFAFALPREGGALSIDAFAIPRDAPHADEAYALLNFLLRPKIAAANARVARLVDPLKPDRDALLKRLWPEGVYDPRVASAVQAEWARLRANKKSATGHARGTRSR